MASVEWKEVNRKLDKINELILKTKADLKERPDNTIVILGLCFLLIDWLSFGKAGGGGGGESFKKGLEKKTIFMDVICVSSLTEYRVFEIPLNLIFS